MYIIHVGIYVLKVSQDAYIYTCTYTDAQMCTHTHTLTNTHTNTHEKSLQYSVNLECKVFPRDT